MSASSTIGLKLPLCLLAIGRISGVVDLRLLKCGVPRYDIGLYKLRGRCLEERDGAVTHEVPRH